MKHNERAHKNGSAKKSATQLNEESFRALVDGLNVGVAYLSSRGKVLYSNPRFAELVGYHPHTPLRGKQFNAVVSAASWPSLNEALLKASHRAVEGELRVALEDKQRVVRMTLAPAKNFDGEDAISATAVETTDLVIATDALRDRESALRSLTARILHVQDAERRKIARDLHDVTAQEIAVINMTLAAAVDNSGRPRASFRAKIDEAVALLNKIQGDIRTLSYVLHPPLLDERGLGAALRWYIDGFQKRSGIEVKLDMPVRPPRLPIEDEIALFRVVQEGLTNVLRHSGSARAKISVATSDNELRLCVEDEGKGNNLRKLGQIAGEDSPSRGRAEFGVGIPGLRERMTQLGGTLDLTATKSGTQLVACLPIAGKVLEQAASDSRDSGQIDLSSEANAVPRTRILIADDHEVARQGIRALLAPYADLEICAEAQDGMEAVAKTKQLHPDLLILDLSMPGVGGLSAVQHVREAGLTPKVLIYTTHSYPGLDRVLRAANCDGYVQKANAGQDLLAGVRAVMRGDTFFVAEAVKESSA
jgi:two-component system, NarL family, sensor kinase